MSLRVAVDIGGTFTDFVCLDETTGKIIEEKTHTTPDNFARGVEDAIDIAGINLEEVNYFVHGTTVVINAVTERSGAKTALLTTKGFRDVLDIGRANRPDMYNYFYKKPVPYVPRYLRYEVNERVAFDGEVLKELDEAEVRAVAKKMKDNGVEAVAVSFLHSYKNPTAEERAEQILREELPGVPISISSNLARIWREYERTSTTVLNAYVMPSTQLYLDTLEEHLHDKKLIGEPHAMLSNGGTATFSRAKEIPINLIESGPVGGVIGAAALGEIMGEPNIITFDVGGTTAKTSLINKGELNVTTEYKLEWTPLFAGHPVKTPVVDIIEIGNGGGSIAWIDEVGVLKVGPRSAGAHPGPACYDLGGTEPTLTDANLIIGRISADNFLGGTFKVNVEKAREAVKPIAEFFNISIEEAAQGIIQTANSNMLNALKLISVRRGYDPQDFAMLVQGGNGAGFGPQLAKELKVKKVIVPNLPGTFSAWGMLVSDLRQDFMQTNIMPVTGADLEVINSIYDDMEAQAEEIFAKQDIPKDKLLIQRSAEMRYIGQEHGVVTPVAGGLLDVAAIEAARKKFDDLHYQNYRFKLEGAPVEFVSFNMTVFGVVAKPEVKKLEVTGRELAAALKGERNVMYEGDGVKLAPVYDRALLEPGHTILGPAVVEESKSVTVMCPGQELIVDDLGNLIISNLEE